MGPIDVTAEFYTVAIVRSKIPVAVCVAPAGDRLFTVAKTLGHKLGDEVLVATIDADDQPKLAQALDAADKPTLLVINEGYVVMRTTEIQGAKAMGERITRAIARSEMSASEARKDARTERRKLREEKKAARQRKRAKAKKADGARKKKPWQGR